MTGSAIENDKSELLAGQASSNTFDVSVEANRKTVEDGSYAEEVAGAYASKENVPFLNDNKSCSKVRPVTKKKKKKSDEEPAPTRKITMSERMISNMSSFA